MPRLTDIVGQEQALAVLRRAITAGKLAQAYLFSGPEGVGKVSAARALAAALSCADAPGEGCASCTSCRKLEAGVHPDLHLIVADGAQIKIDQVRALEEHLGYAPHEGRWRVIVIDGAETLNLNAANALLKSVEEPRPATLFVFCSVATHRVVPTLLSRCQRVRFRPLPREALLAVVHRCAPERSPEEVQAALALAAGSAGRALRVLASVQLSTMRETATALFDAARRGDPLAIFEAAGAAGKDRLEIGEVLDYLRTWLRDLLLVTEGLEEGRLINADQLSALRAAAVGLDGRAVVRQLRAVDEAQTAVRGNVQPALALENLVLRLRGVEAMR